MPLFIMLTHSYVVQWGIEVILCRAKAIALPLFLHVGQGSPALPPLSHQHMPQLLPSAAGQGWLCLFCSSKPMNRLRWCEMWVKTVPACIRTLVICYITTSQQGDRGGNSLHALPFEWAICRVQKEIIYKRLTACIVSKMAR